MCLGESWDLPAKGNWCCGASAWAEEEICRKWEVCQFAVQWNGEPIHFILGCRKASFWSNLSFSSKKEKSDKKSFFCCLKPKSTRQKWIFFIWSPPSKIVLDSWRLIYPQTLFLLFVYFLLLPNAVCDSADVWPRPVGDLLRPHKWDRKLMETLQKVCWRNDPTSWNHLKRFINNKILVYIEKVIRNIKKSTTTSKWCFYFIAKEFVTEAESETLPVSYFEGASVCSSSFCYFHICTKWTIRSFSFYYYD